jgi:hypothetical protein
LAQDVFRLGSGREGPAVAPKCTLAVNSMVEQSLMLACSP